MNDDIVTRLREAERLVRDSQMDCDDTGDLIDWCADEIERLREQNEYLKANVEQLVHEAVRGE